MSLNNPTNNHPELIELVDFLIEKSRDVKSPLNIEQLAEEFKATSGSSQGLVCLLNRIHRFRPKIFQINSIDTEVKVKMIFGLSAPIDENFLNELRVDAHVEVDGKDRITRYRANDGSLELKGDHSRSAKNMSGKSEEYMELIDFLIEKTKDAKSSMNILRLAEEFKETSGSSQKLACLRARIATFRLKICEMDSIDTTAKVRMLVALGGSINEHFLNELQKDAHVEIDENSRITKYTANDGSLELEEDHSRSAKKKKGWKKRKMENKKSQEDSDDESVETSLSTTPGSTKRAATAEVPSSSKRTRNSSPSRLVKEEDYIADDSLRTPESRARKVDRRLSPQSPRVQQCREPKLEEAPESSDARTRQEASGGAQRTPEESESEADEAYTPQINFLEAIHFLVMNLELDMPNLSRLQAKIEKNLRESPNAQIPNEEIILAMEVLVTKITNHSVSNLPENVKSVSLSNFLCYLKAAILNSKLEGLEDLMEKIQGRINNPSLKLKNIPVKKVASDLRTTLDVVKL